MHSGLAPIRSDFFPPKCGSSDYHCFAAALAAGAAGAAGELHLD